MSDACSFDFDWITEDLAVGGSFPCESARTLAAAHEIGAVVDLRAEACDDEATLAALDISFLHLPTDDSHGVALPMLDRGVAFAGTAARERRRVLIHCEHGVGRSANLALCILAARGLAPLPALRLLKDRRAVISLSRSQFESWCGWLRRHGERSGAPVALPAWDAFTRIAWENLVSADG